MMSYYAFTACHPEKAAKELREHGYDAFCVQMVDRRRKHRHRAKGPDVWEPKAIVALGGYCFVASPDLWSISKMRHVGQAVRFCGRLEPIPDHEMDRVLSSRGLYFRDDDPPKALAQRGPATVSPGDVVRFGMAAETIDAPVMSTDGHTVLVKLRTLMLGRDTMRIPLGMVEIIPQQLTG